MLNSLPMWMATPSEKNLFCKVFPKKTTEEDFFHQNICNKEDFSWKIVWVSAVMEQQLWSGALRARERNPDVVVTLFFAPLRHFTSGPT